MIRKPLLVVAVTAIALLCVGTVNAQSNAAKPVPASKAATTAPGAQAIPPEVDAAFAAWDADHNGALSLQEFHSGWMMMRRASEAQSRLRTQFNTIDANRNGAIDGNEYANLMLVKKAGKSAPSLSAFDANKNQRLEFPEYLEFISRMTQSQSAPATKKTP